MPTPIGYTSAYTSAEIDERLGAVPNKADKIQEVNHGTSDTTFTLTPNVMHIWGTVASLNLSLPTDSNSTLDEYLFTFTCGSTPTTLTLPATIKWIQDPEFEENKTYQVSIVNNLAGYLTNGMVAGSSGGGGGENNVIESISVNGVAQTVSSKNVDLLFKTINNTPIEGSGNITISEAELSWGGKNLANAYSPVDAAMIGSLGANRWAFLPAAQISIEYTLDGGVTWLDYDGLSDGNKTGLFTDDIGTSIWLGHNSKKHAITTDELLRITVNCSPDGGATSNMYQYINKFAIFSSGDDHLGRYVTILGRTETNVESNVDTWVTLVDKAIIGGNSGWSIINTNEIKLFGRTYKQFYGQIRFIFGQNLPTTSDYTYSVSRIHAYGKAWTAPSDMAMKGSLFTWNYAQDAYFPGHIIPNGTGRSLGTTSNRWDSIFSSYGNFSGNVNIANNLSVTGTTILTGLLTANGGIVVPSGKTITVDGKEVLTEHQDISGLVPTTRTINGKALSANINLTASEVGALPDSTVIPTVPTNVSAFTNDANYVSSTNTVAIYSGSSAPSSSTGKNGDIYIQTS